MVRSLPRSRPSCLLPDTIRGSVRAIAHTQEDKAPTREGGNNIEHTARTRSRPGPHPHQTIRTGLPAEQALSTATSRRRAEMSDSKHKGDPAPIKPWNPPPTPPSPDGQGGGDGGR
ncbi:hypothetical protein SSP24_73010 [Streptomyces spinoverrucosus]|uniref:Uncharacterized protein n=1 Tax=Streptomyces spinoverrucosus TaxID=284043 RepID=A0A4Y3VX92_9ACTN|nr:hypothetical protein SSP24_73010 [Streptomyces spinoverrucosus]GHB70595.1 hypothetical protein GCM10010397_46100 [Streptomyces spinoverrucosus]